MTDSNVLVDIKVDKPEEFVEKPEETSLSTEVTADANNQLHPRRREGRARTRSHSNSPKRSRSPSRNRSASVESRSRSKRDTESAINDAVPLLPESSLGRPLPPIAGPEIDDINDSGDENRPTLGIDDGFFTTDAPIPKNGAPVSPNGNGFVPSRRGSVPFPYAPDFGPGVIAIPGEPPRIIPDVNIYQHKKTLAQGMMDLALLSANANQLRYVLEAKNHPYFYFSLSFISASLLLQVLVGLGLVMISRYNVKNDNDIVKADRYNNMVTIGILLITIINVFVSAFGVAESSTS